jgi:hypothetical protein
MALLSLGEFLWSLLTIFFMVIYFTMIFHVIVDVFTRRDASGLKKAAWLLFLLAVPLVGLLSYVVTNGDAVAHRNLERAAIRQEQFDAYVRETAGSGDGAAGEIERGKQLLDSGAIDQVEYEQIKTKALAGAV